MALDVFLVLDWLVLTGVDHYHIFTNYFLLHRELSFLTLHVLYFVSRGIQDKVITLVLLFFRRIQETVQGMVIHALKVQSNRRKELFFLYLSEQIVWFIIALIPVWLLERSRLNFKVQRDTFWDFAGGKHLLWFQKHLFLPDHVVCLKQNNLFLTFRDVSLNQRAFAEGETD